MNKKEEAVIEIEMEMFKAFSHSKRIKIIRLLCMEERSTAQLIKILKLPKANLSQHMSILKSVGLISSRKEGVQVFYKLADAKLTTVCRNMNDLATNFIKSKSKLL